MAVQCWTATHGGHFSIWAVCTFSAKRQQEQQIQAEGTMAFLTPLLMANDYKYSTHMYKIHSNVHTDRLPASLFSSPTRKLCSRETNCCVALALQWRMKVHRTRQTSIPLQPPLSNKHIYYSGWARLVVSLHTPPTSCYSGQWDSGCTTLGISTRMRKKKTNGLPLSLPKGHIAAVYILEERVSSSDDVLWFFLVALLRLGALPFPPSFFTMDMCMTSLPQRQAAQFIGSTVS